MLEFETYSPKAFASIKEIDQDLKDRCIELNMVRAEKEYPYRKPFSPYGLTCEISCIACF